MHVWIGAQKLHEVAVAARHRLDHRPAYLLRATVAIADTRKARVDIADDDYFGEFITIYRRSGALRAWIFFGRSAPGCVIFRRILRDA